jgi:Uncharacterized membrane protein
MQWKTTFQVASTYVGAVMGAGFASGQEIQQFFVRFGYWGLAGIILSAFLFSVLGLGMLELQGTWKVSSYGDFFEQLMGSKLGHLADKLVSVLLFVGMIAMISGSGALFNEYFGISGWIGIILTGIVITLALWFRGEGVLWINTVLIPLKFMACMGIALAAILLASSGDGEGIPIVPPILIQNWAASAVLYVSFNLTLAIVVFASLGRAVQKPGARLGAVLGGVALGLFAFVIGVSLLRFPEICGLEIPMVAVAGKLGGWPAFFYVVVLWLAMITAAVGNGFSLVSRVVDSKKYKYGNAIIVLILMTTPLASIKFSQIVQFVYPLFGYIGFVFLPTILYFWLKAENNS